MSDIKVFKLTLIGLLLMLIVAILSGCKTTQYVPVETVRIEKEYIDKYHRDSIHVFDSVYIRDKGDTVWLTRWRIEYRDKLIRDSIFIRDSINIQIPYPVERDLTRWEKTKMDMGGVAIGGLITLIICLITWLIIWLKKKFGKH